MSRAEAEAVVVRRRKRRSSRWMRAERRRRVLTKIGLCWQALPGFFLALADMLGVPSGLHAAYMTALCARGGDVRWSMAGSAAAMVLRLLWGLSPRWEMLATLAIMYFLPAFIKGCGTAKLMACTAFSLLPTLGVALADGMPALIILALASMAVGALSAPVFLRAQEALHHSRPLDCLEDRLAVGYLGVMMLCGGGRMLLIGMNVGVLGASALTLLCAMCLGTGAGVVLGMVSGLVLAMQGLPMMLSIALSIGGFLAGMAHMLGRRGVTSLMFCAGAVGVMILSGTAGVGCALSAAAAAIVVALLPRRRLEAAQLFFRRFLSAQPVSGDAYAASALAAWEKTVAAMAEAVPSPVDEEESRAGQWWRDRLCAGCPEEEQCTCMLTERACQQAELVWESRAAETAVWQDARETLRGLGCARLYHLRENMELLRLEDMEERRKIARICTQRDMLVTHLSAMSGAARRFAMLSAGDSWWDDMSARRLRKALSELDYPASVMYVRRVQGHARAAFSLHSASGAKKQAQELRVLASRVLEAPMALISCDDDRVELTEQPLMQVEYAVAARGYKGGEHNGDTAWAGLMQDGRFLAALSDGMGHGRQAAKESYQTVNLLRLCLDAGYTRAQTLTAVNGMMLMAGRGERFSTVDLLTIDLWNGQAALDKMGAAGSYLIQGGALTCVTGDALPLGILETVESRSSVVRLRAGDAVILMTDGVEDAFSNKAALEEAVRLCALEPTAQEAADALLLRVQEASAGERTDDQTVIVLRLTQAAQEA